MKSLHFHLHGDFESLHYGDIATAEPAQGEVVIRVKASAINHLDLWVLRGWPELRLNMPHVGGADIAGEIANVGKDVSGWKIGERVVVNPGVLTKDDEWTARGEDSVSPSYKIFGESLRGGFAEYVSVPASNLMAIPEGFDFVEVAAPLLVSLTAWRMLKIRAELQPGQTVLVVGAGGGLNSLSVQLANLLGATVIALTSSKQKAEKIRALGAKHVIDYIKCPDWSRKVKLLTKDRGVDVVVDNVGAKTITQSIRSLVRGGKIVTVGNTSGPLLAIDNRLIFTKQISIIGSTMGSRSDFDDVMKLIWARKLKPIVDRTLPLKDGRIAYEMLERGEQFGKVVLVP